MPDDNRLDLNADLDKVSSDLLKDVEAATREVKTRKAADREKDRRNAVKDKDRKTSVIIIAVAVVLLIAIASWMAFGRQDNATAAPPSGPVPQQNSKINVPVSNVGTPKAPPRVPRQNNDQQGSQQPYSDDSSAPGQ